MTEGAHGAGEQGGSSAGILDEWVSQPDLAAEMEISPDTLRKWRLQRKGPPAIKVGARVFYRRESVREWLRSLEKK